MPETISACVGFSDALDFGDTKRHRFGLVAASRLKDRELPRTDKPSPNEFGCQRVAIRCQLPCSRNLARDHLLNAPSLRDSLADLTGGTHPVGPNAAWATVASPASVPTTGHLSEHNCIRFDEDDSRGHCGGAPECKSTPSESDKRFARRQRPWEECHCGNTAHLLPLPHRLGRRSHSASPSSDSWQIISNATILSIQVLWRLSIVTTPPFVRAQSGDQSPWSGLLAQRPSSSIILSGPRGPGYVTSTFGM